MICGDESLDMFRWAFNVMWVFNDSGGGLTTCGGVPITTRGGGAFMTCGGGLMTCGTLYNM